ncbi:hypothetical protein Golax_010136 [Gossypium laxum]|uniref:Uncharacterized protein n=1 Tax=Gossypium laxum TaxID=34288 RepID=A0A7J8ZGH8_9ROSI|nr:hypothetical protein [Gossypium laxum]
MQLSRYGLRRHNKRRATT